MKLVWVLFIFLIVAACHKKELSVDNAEVGNGVEQTELEKVQQEKKNKSAVSLDKPKISKTFRESIHFAASLEREALKLLLRDQQMQKNTLFSVLSYATEAYSGSKKSTPFGLDCGKFNVELVKSKIIVHKSCLKPPEELAIIDVISEDKVYEVTFRINSWKSVLGAVTALTGSDVKCRLNISDRKLSMINCENWSYQVGSDHQSSTVLKANEFLFLRSAAKQFVIKGGYFKDLVQNKKFDIVVPLEGKIKIIEKEIKVIDEFADHKDGFINGAGNEKKERIEIKPVEEKNDQEKNDQEKNNDQKDSQTEGQSEVEGTPEYQALQEIQSSQETQDQQVIQPTEVSPSQQPQSAPGNRGSRGR